jgi:UDP-glucose 4-epimerase
MPSREPGHLVVDVRSAALSDAMPRGADAVVHLAAISRDADCVRDPRTAVETNVGGALNVLEAARANHVPQLIFASSEWVYGEVAGQEAQTENMLIDVRRIGSEYALTKLMAERLLQLASARHPETIVTVLRFGIVYGPRPSNWSAVEQLFYAVRSGEPVVVRGSLRTARRFIHVSDVASGILSAVGRSTNEVFNLSGDKLITLGDIVAESAELLGSTPTVTEGDPTAVSVRNPENALARRLLGWVPAIGLRDGLRTLQTT